jgi:DNA repair exonuclease SbcCD nuclease subunit
MPLTFIHTSDWHLGRTMSRLGRHATHVRQWRFEAVRRMYDLALAHHAQFILVAGDVFQHAMPPPALLDEALHLLRDAPVPLVLIPGNHDPCEPGSIWQQEELGRRLQHLPHVHLGLEQRPIELADGAALVFPCAVTSKNSPDDQTAWIPAGRRGECFRIGLAHGILQGYDGQEHFENFITAERADLAGLDYLALGDLHSYTQPDHPAARRRTYYSGTIECTAVDEERPGYVLLVQIPSPGAEPTVTPLRVGRMQPRKLPPLTVSPGEGLYRLREAVAAIENPAEVWLALQVQGALSLEEMEDFNAWEGELLGRFLGVDLDRSGLICEPSREDFEQLGLDESEKRVLELLEDPARAAAAAGWKQDDWRAGLFARADVCREARAMFYRYLREAERDH